MGDGSLRPDNEAGYYCYCVAGSDASLDLAGLSGIEEWAPPHPLRVGRLQVVLSRTPAEDHREDVLRTRLRQMEWVEVAVLSHERVVEACLRQTAVIPMKFCTIFRSERDVIAAFTDMQDQLIGRLRDLEGKLEWGVRLVADRERLRRHLLENDPELLSLLNGISSNSEGAAYFLRKRLEDRLARAAEQARADAARDVYARLAAVATRAVLVKPPRPQPGDEEQVLNAAFLVTDDQLGLLLGQAEGIVSERPWLRFEPSGPWPPYNFV